MVSTEELQKEILRLQKELSRYKKQLKDKKYGLVWLDVPEAFEEESENQMPVLEEVKELSIKNDDGKPTHILIEGDNYHALTCLNYTHKGKIDLIYIDPPYNTGSDGFRYKDKRWLKTFPDGTEVPKNSPLRHSYWLSFIFKRIELARNLLKETGLIVISIDDNELANLILVCSQIFGDSNQVAILPTIMNLKGNQDQFGFAGTHEYTLVFAKNISKCNFNQFEIDEEEQEDWEIDDIGYFKKGAPLRATGEADKREDRPEMFYPILIKDGLVSTILKEEHSKIYDKKIKKFDDRFLKLLLKKYKKNGFKIVLPISGEYFGRWRWGFSEINRIKLKTDVIINETKNGITLYKKQRPQLNDLPSKKPKTLFYKPEYSSGNGTNQLKNIVPNNNFKAPKPVDLIKDFLKICSPKNSIILDFFAGSGTTLQASLELNNDDHKIQNIICTNNENNICKTVTYPRISNLINGYSDINSNYISSLGNSLKYYKTAFVGKNNIKGITDEDKAALALKCGYLLAITENTLEETKFTKYQQHFTNNKKNTSIYFQEDLTEYQTFFNTVEQSKIPTTVYLFSWEDDNEFEQDYLHLEYVTVKSIPKPIIEIYKNIFNLDINDLDNEF